MRLCAVEQESWRKPGSVSSSVAVLPPTTDRSSRTSTSKPAFARCAAVTRLLCPAPAITTSVIGYRRVRGQDQLCRPRLADRSRARPVPRRGPPLRDAAPRDAGDPFPRAGGREGVLARVEPHLP